MVLGRHFSPVLNRQQESHKNLVCSLVVLVTERMTCQKAIVAGGGGANQQVLCNLTTPTFSRHPRP